MHRNRADTHPNTVVSGAAMGALAGLLVALALLSLLVLGRRARKLTARGWALIGVLAAAGSVLRLIQLFRIGT